MNIIRISEPVLKTICYFFIGDDRKEVVEYLEKKYKFAKTDETFKMFKEMIEDANGIHTAAISDSGYEDIIWLNTKFTAGLVAHEINHMLFERFKYVDVPHTRDTDEMYAYYLTWAIDEFYKKYDKSMEKSKE